MKILSVAKEAVVILWTVGGRLRRIYNDSTSLEQRVQDRNATFVRVALFGGFVAFVTATETGSVDLATLRAYFSKAIKP